MTDRKIRLFWVGDAVASTGFSRVTHSVLDALHETGDYEIQVLGVNYFGDPHDFPYYVWPARLGGDVLGYNRLIPLVNEGRPDMVVLFNDLWVVNEYTERLAQDKYTGKVMTYFPVDSTGFDADWCRQLYMLDAVAVYTEFGKQVIREAGYKGDVAIIPHGIDTEKFYPLDKLECRAELEGMSPEDFIIFNGNRNQPRKRIDITIKAFCQFAMNAPNARLYLHMGVGDIGWNILTLFHREARRCGLKDAWEKLLLTSPNLGPSNSVTVQTLNTIYNCADLGVNTSLGEGWGLVSFEQSACGVPQIVPNYSACKEIYAEGRGTTIEPFYYMSNQKINTEGGLVHEDEVAAAFQKYYDDPLFGQAQAADMFDYIKRPEFEWANIAKQWDKLIKETLET
jgi:glycosyltransferase involved in cell wall biosynthesis